MLFYIITFYQNVIMPALSKDLLQKFFENSEIQQNIKQILKPLGYILYDQFYPYIWLICLYNVILIFLVVFILLLLLWNWRGNDLFAAKYSFLES